VPGKHTKPSFIPKLKMELIEKTIQEDEENKLIYEKLKKEKKQAQGDFYDKEKKVYTQPNQSLAENRKIQIPKPQTKNFNIKIEEVDFLESEIIDLAKEDKYFEVNLQDENVNGQGNF